MNVASSFWDFRTFQRYCKYGHRLSLKGTLVSCLSKTQLCILNVHTWLVCCPAEGGTVARRLMVVPLVLMGWGMRGDKVGRVMTTLAWGGGGAGLSVFWAPVPAVPCCCPWCPAEAAVAMATACWEIWCMMACMNSGGSPGTWMGPVVPSENKRTEFSEKWLLTLLENETAARSEFYTQDYKQLTNNSCVTSQCKNSTLKGSYDIAKKNIILCNAMCLCGLR